MTKIGKSGHQRAFLIALIAVGAALVLSVVSFANTSTSSTVTVTVGGVGGEFGFSVGQGIPASMGFGSDNDGDTVTVSGGTNNFAVGDYILIDEEGDDDPDGDSASVFSYHTITAINVDNVTLTVDPDISNTYSGSASVNEKAPNSGSASWSPSIGSTSSITAGNHFNINLQGLDSTDAALIEVFLTNTDELVKNYTFLHRLVNVKVLCDSVSCGTGSGTSPYSSGSANNGTWEDAVDAAGTLISDTEDYLTLTNARQAFILLGGYTYALVIDGGTLFTIDVTEVPGSDSLSPTDLVQLTAL